MYDVYRRINNIYARTGLRLVTVSDSELLLSWVRMREGACCFGIMQRDNCQLRCLKSIKAFQNWPIEG